MATSGVSSAQTALQNAVSSSNSTSSSSSTSSDGQAIAGNFQQFLTLLTTQLQNQSPLDPLDTNQFTAQLVQFASVEQQLKTNSLLTSMSNGAKAQTAAAAASLVGQNVTVDSSVAVVKSGSGSWTITPAKAAASATISIKDSNGKVVATQTKALAAGAQTFSWDGRQTDGSTAADGTYTISVNATDATGSKVDVSTEVSGQVTAIDVSGDTPMLVINGTSVPLSSLKTLGSS